MRTASIPQLPKLIKTRGNRKLSNKTFLFAFRMMDEIETPQWFLATGFLLSGFALVGNSFMILLIASKQPLHRITNCFLVSLSFADLGVSLSMFPSNYFCLPIEECRYHLLASFQWAFLYASVANLCALTADRYIAIVKPFIYVLFMRRSRAVAFISAAWILPFIFAFVPLTFINDGKHVLFMRNYTYIAIVIFEFIPMVTLLFVTAHMLYIARKHARETASVIQQLRYNQPAPGSTNELAVRHGNRAWSSVAFIAFVVVFFVLCYSITVGQSCCNIFKLCDSPFELELVQELVLIANSAFNPFAYALLKQDIKKEVKQLLRVGAAERQRSPIQMEQR